jgi:hypothetical protein
MEITRLFDALDGARLVVVEEDMGLVFTWHGASLVNILDANLEAMDVIGLRGNDLEGVTAREVREVIRRWVEALREEEEEEEKDHA